MGLLDQILFIIFAFQLTWDFIKLVVPADTVLEHLNHIMVVWSLFKFEFIPGVMQEFLEFPRISFAKFLYLNIQFLFANNLI